MYKASRVFINSAQKKKSRVFITENLGLGLGLGSALSKIRLKLDSFAK